MAHSYTPCNQILAWLSIRFSMLPNLTNQYISYSMAIFSANEIRTFFHKNHMQFFSTSTTRAYWLMLIHSTWWTVSKCLGFFVIFPEIAFFSDFIAWIAITCYISQHCVACAEAQLPAFRKSLEMDLYASNPLFSHA